MDDILSKIAEKKYINLETYKKDSTPIRTPVWFVVDGQKFYVITRDQTGKVKRLRNNPKIKFAVCGFRGEIQGDWHSATTSIVEGDEAKNAIKMRKKKYGFKAFLAGIMSKTKGNIIVYSLTLDSN